MDKHVRTLAILNIVLGILGLFVAIAILYFNGGKDGLLNITPAEKEAGGIPLSSMPISGLYLLILSIYLILITVPLVATGLGLLRFQPWARWVGLALNAVNMMNVPLGSLVGVYAIWVLMSLETEPLFEDKPGERD